MFGWIKRRLLARRCRQELQTVDSYSRARARMAAVRWAHTPPPTCARAPESYFDARARAAAAREDLASMVPPAYSPGGIAIDGLLITLAPDQDLEALVREIKIRGGLCSARSR